MRVVNKLSNLAQNSVLLIKWSETLIASGMQGPFLSAASIVSNARWAKA